MALSGGSSRSTARERGEAFERLHGMPGMAESIVAAGERGTSAPPAPDEGASRVPLSILERRGVSGPREFGRYAGRTDRGIGRPGREPAWRDEQPRPRA